MAEAPLLVKVDGEPAEPNWTAASQLVGSALFASLTAQLRTRAQTGSQCPHCCTTADQVSDSGLVGCPLCYVALSAVAATVV
jgi:protein-arginine kinase activator protein McsA